MSEWIEIGSKAWKKPKVGKRVIGVHEMMPYHPFVMTRHEDESGETFWRGEDKLITVGKWQPTHYTTMPIFKP